MSSKLHKARTRSNIKEGCFIPGSIIGIIIWGKKLKRREVVHTWPRLPTSPPSPHPHPPHFPAPQPTPTHKATTLQSTKHWYIWHRLINTIIIIWGQMYPLKTSRITDQIGGEGLKIHSVSLTKYKRLFLSPSLILYRVCHPEWKC